MTSTVLRSRRRGFRADTHVRPTRPRPPAPTAPARAPGPRPTWRRTPAAAKAVHATRHIRRAGNAPPLPVTSEAWTAPSPPPWTRGAPGRAPGRGAGSRRCPDRAGVQAPDTGHRGAGRRAPAGRGGPRTAIIPGTAHEYGADESGIPPSKFLLDSWSASTAGPAAHGCRTNARYLRERARPRRPASRAPDVVRTADQGQHHAAGRRDPARGDLSEPMPGPATKQPQRRVQESSPALGLGAMRSTCHQNGRSAPWGLAVAGPLSSARDPPPPILSCPESCGAGLSNLLSSKSL